MLDVCWIGPSADSFSGPMIRWLLQHYDRVSVRHDANDVFRRFSSDDRPQLATLGVYYEPLSGTDSSSPARINPLRKRFAELVHVRGPLASGFQRHPVQPSVCWHQFKDWVRQFRDDHAGHGGGLSEWTNGASTKPAGQVLLRTHDASIAEIWLDNFAAHGRGAIWSPNRHDVGNRIDEVWWDESVAVAKTVDWSTALSPYSRSVRHVWVTAMATEHDVQLALAGGVSRVIERPQWSDFAVNPRGASGRHHRTLGDSGGVRKMTSPRRVGSSALELVKPPWRRVA